MKLKFLTLNDYHVIPTKQKIIIIERLLKPFTEQVFIFDHLWEKLRKLIYTVTHTSLCMERWCKYSENSGLSREKKRNWRL